MVVIVDVLLRRLSPIMAMCAGVGRNKLLENWRLEGINWKEFVLHHRLSILQYYFELYIAI